MYCLWYPLCTAGLTHHLVIVAIEWTDYGQDIEDRIVTLKYAQSQTSS